jgi:hypothetical protein
MNITVELDTADVGIKCENNCITFLSLFPFHHLASTNIYISRYKNF